MVITFTVLLILTSLLLILLILLHKGRGGGLSDMFGGGVSSGLAAIENLNHDALVEPRQRLGRDERIDAMMARVDTGRRSRAAPSTSSRHMLPAQGGLDGLEPAR